MVETPIELYITVKRGTEPRAVARYEPVQNGRFHAARIVRSRSIRTLLNLKIGSQKRQFRTLRERTILEMATTSSALAFITRSSKPGVMDNNFVKTRSSLRSLRERDERQ